MTVGNLFRDSWYVKWPWRNPPETYCIQIIPLHAFLISIDLVLFFYFHIIQPTDMVKNAFSSLTSPYLLRDFLKTELTVSFCSCVKSVFQWAAIKNSTDEGVYFSLKEEVLPLFVCVWTSAIMHSSLRTKVHYPYPSLTAWIKWYLRVVYSLPRVMLKICAFKMILLQSWRR